MTTTSVIIPVRDHAALTRRCLDAVLRTVAADVEVVVVDDGSEDATPDVLESYGSRITVVRHTHSAGFAVACNHGARCSRGDVVVFLNNDTVPRDGWLDALVATLAAHPRTGAVGARLLYPDGTVQHAGVVFDRTGEPRHAYAGFPGDHPAVLRSRRLHAVTGACLAVTRRAFTHASAFDTDFRNGLEDVDLCLRLGELGYEVRYCADAVVEHLESATRGDDRVEAAANGRRLRARWTDRLPHDDLAHLVDDGLLAVRYDGGRAQVAVDAALGGGHADGADTARLLARRGRQVHDLLAEVVRLTVRVAELELASAERAELVVAPLVAAEHDESLEDAVHALQERLAVRAGAPGVVGPGLAYRRLLRAVRAVALATTDPGSVVLVVSRGDDALVDLPGRVARHFPADPSGEWAGHHPVDGAAALEALIAERARDARYLVVPAPSRWWLDHYGELAAHLAATEVVHDGEACTVFDLTRVGSPSRRLLPSFAGHGEAP